MITALARALRVVATALAFAGFFIGGCLLSWVVLPVVAVTVRDRMARVRRCQRVVASGFRLFHAYMRLTRILHFAPRDVVFERPERPFVVVANHPTLVDVTALVSVLGEVCVVAKRSMFRSPLVGRLLRYGWHIEAARDPIADGPRVLRECSERLAAGLPVLIFPEGTRSPVGGLHPFKRGAFEVAVRADAPVVAMRLTCEPPVLSRAHPWYTTPAAVPRLRIEHLATLAPTAWVGDAKGMARDVGIRYSPSHDVSSRVNGLSELRDAGRTDATPSTVVEHDVRNAGAAR